MLQPISTFVTKVTFDGNNAKYLYSNVCKLQRMPNVIAYWIYQLICKKLVIHRTVFTAAVRSLTKDIY